MARRSLPAFLLFAFLTVTTASIVKVAQYNTGTAGYNCPDSIFSDERYGYTHSPRYPDKYPNTAACSYIITAPAGNIVELALWAFSTEACCDRLDIIDGHPNDGRMLKTLAGDESLAPVRVYKSSGRVMSLNFTSDPQINRRGFYARFDASPKNDKENPSKNNNCPVENKFTNPWGVFVSPHWPYNYPNTANCDYHISAPKGKRIQLQVNYFHTEAGADELTVFDDAEGEKLLKRMSGRYDDSYTLTSTGNAMALKFISDMVTNYEGFSFTYTVI